jgi:hypothetical protein
MVWLVAFVGLYWMSNGTPAGIPAYLYNSAQIVSGYSEAMAWPGWYWVAVVALTTCLVLLIAVPLLAGEKRRMAPAIPPVAVIAFLCFKSAMVREDVHALPFQFEIAMAALLFLALASTPRGRIVTGAFAVASLALGIAAVSQLWPEYLPSCWDRFSGYAALQNLNRFLHWPETVRTLEADTGGMLLPDRLPPEFLPLLAGKNVTAYPWEIASIRANRLRWQPLPVLQAYCAYTPSLDLLNASALEGSDGPEEILFSWNSIDGRHPFYETPRSWQALLDWYDLYLTLPDLYVLRRRATPRFDSAVPAGEIVAHWDETIVLPAVASNEILTMEANITQSLIGVCKRTLFRSIPIVVQAVRQSGVVVNGRVVRANLPDGVIVSDWPTGRIDLLPMLAPSPTPFQDRVVSIRFQTLGPAEYNPAIRIRWSRRPLRH